jgi:hypothetical protein
MQKIVPLIIIILVCEVYSLPKYYFKINFLHQKNKSCRHYKYELICYAVLGKYLYLSW